MLTIEKSTAEIKKHIEGSFKWGLMYHTKTTFDQDYDLFPEIKFSERISNLENAKTKYPRIEENLNIKVIIDFYSFANSLFPESRSFNKEEQSMFEKIRSKIFKEI